MDKLEKDLAGIEFDREIARDFLADAHAAMLLDSRPLLLSLFRWLRRYHAARGMRGEDLTLLIVELRRDDDGNRLTDHLLRLVAKDPRSSAIPGEDASLKGLADDRIVRGVDDRSEPGPLFFIVLTLADIDKSDHDTTDDTAHRAVRPDPHQKGLAVLSNRDFVLDHREGAQYLLRVALQIVVAEPVGDVGDRPAAVAGAYMEDLRQGGRKIPYAQLAIKKQRSDLCTVEKVLPYRCLPRLIFHYWHGAPNLLY